MRQVNIIPMAGAGQRFVKEGYLTPKPLIDVKGKPMVVRAANSLPPADKWIFVCQRQHIENSEMEAVLRSEFNDCEIVLADRLPQGQACSCLLASPFMEETDCVSIGPCDVAYSYSQKSYLDQLKQHDAIVFTCSPTEIMLSNPRAYGWVNIDDDHKVQNITCKKVASDTPENDQVIVGAFGFNQAKFFSNAVHDMIKMKLLVRGEYYLDTAIANAFDLGYKISALKIDRIDNWGTPEELQAWLKDN